MTPTDKRWLDFPAIFTLIAAVLVAASRVSATNWTEDIGIVVLLALIGSILGAALGYSRFHPRLVALFALVYTVFFVTWRLGLTIGGETTGWIERVQSLGGRIGMAATQFATNQPTTDSILFITSMALLFWFIALAAGYQLVRHGRPWQALIVAGITLVIVDMYSPAVPRSNFYSGVFILLVLLLLTELYYMKSRFRWRERGVAVDTDTEFSLGRGALVGALVLILLAWNLPTVVLALNPGTIEQRDMSDLWADIRQRFENATASLQGPLLLEQEYYGDQLSLGTGNPLSDDLIFTVQPSIEGSPGGSSYYWRGRSYDLYDTQSGWDSSVVVEEEIDPESPFFDYPTYFGRTRVTFTVSTRKNLGVLYAPTLPITVSRPAKVLAQTVGTEQVDVLALYANPPVRGGESYEVVASLSAPTISEMRQSGVEYPEWVTEKYLQLPSDFSSSIQDLAETIVEGLDNPYNKAAVITQYLRDTITYQQIIDPIPAGVDPIEHFLFETQAGFCNYYATAEVLMLRAVGVPARMAVGYAQGEYDPESNTYAVRRRQLHAWPEVYFAGLGWVEFEPTVSQPDIARDEGSDNDGGFAEGPTRLTDGNELDRPERDNEIEEQELPPAAAEVQAAPPWAAIIIASVALLLAIPLGMYWIKRRAQTIEPLPVLLESGMKRRGWQIPRWIKRWSHLVRLSPIERSFLAVEGVLALMRRPLDPSATPNEAVTALGEVLPSGLTYAQQLLDEYQRSAYSPYPANLETARAASRSLIREAGRTWLKRLFNDVEIDDTDSYTVAR